MVLKPKTTLTSALSRQREREKTGRANSYQNVQLSSPAPKTSGFSLLELLAVLTILGIVGSITVFQLTPLFSHLRFNAGVRKVVSDLQLVRMKAVAQNQRFRVTFRPDSHDYIIEKASGDSWTRQVLHTYRTADAPEAAIPLPKGVHITAVNSGGDVIFVPRGHIDAGMTLSLSSANEEYTRRIIFSLAGRVRIE
jgi:prepilin-type N-terminal cleavage/methylation domain-containing protein